jgi:hypothetical protein
LCMMFGFEPTTLCIPSCMLYSYATCVNSLVICMDGTRYIITRKDICDMQYLLSGVGRPGRVPCRPPAPAMTSLVRTSTWISLKPILAAQHGLEATMWRLTAARLRNRPRLESWPVSLHLAHTKRVTRYPSPGADGQDSCTLA